MKKGICSAFALLLVGSLKNGDESAAFVAAQDLCLLCDSGSPANGDLVIPLDELGDNPNPTCSQLAAFAAEELPLADSMCGYVRQNQDFCGCPGGATAPLDHCTLCANGSPPANFAAATPFDDTCGELDAYLRYLPAEACGSERVQLMQRADAFCGCPGVEPECTMCADGTNNFTNPDRIVPEFIFMRFNSSWTCKDMAGWYSLINLGDPQLASCSNLQLNAAYCGCPTTSSAPVDACSLCKAGSVLGAPERLIADINMTCGQLAQYMSYVPAESCDVPLIDDLTRFAYFCGCSDATAICPICSDMSVNVSRPDTIIPYLTMMDNFNPTCSQLAMAGIMAREGELINCTAFDLHSDFCGCPDAAEPPGVCEFCPGGAAPPNADLVTPFGDTCGELAEYLSYIPGGSCSDRFVENIQRQDFLCGCASATTSCALCPDKSNSVEFQNRTIPFLSLGMNKAPTCRDVIEFLAVMDGELDPEACSALQGYAGYCGCPSTTPVNACSFCPNGGTPSSPDKVVSDDFTCQGLNDYISFLTNDGCTEDPTDFGKIQAFAYTCGCPNTEPSCTLCPGGQAPTNTGNLTSDGRTTCAQFADIVETMTASQCDAQSANIAAAASTCGCPSGGGSSARQCAMEQNRDLCTTELLATATEECDCYAFCDGVFVKCESVEGGLLMASECSGTPVTGCNRAGLSNAESDSAKAGTGSSSDDNSQTAIIVSAIVVPVILLLFVGVYYAKTRRSKADADKMNAAFEAQSEMSAPVMAGSYSISDLDLDVEPPPSSRNSFAESMASAETPVEDLDDEPKIV